MPKILTSLLFVIVKGKQYSPVDLVMHWNVVRSLGTGARSPLQALAIQGFGGFRSKSMFK